MIYVCIFIGLLGWIFIGYNFIYTEEFNEVNIRTIRMFKCSNVLRTLLEAPLVKSQASTDQPPGTKATN